ncbi:MAG: efflux RND transporter periplasmic adaptor subunit [Gammaproteobacteria bacterium]|nr:efflux RND transporter periplasmic adaptor subunit [Gammaproteobacteria bacterium]
MKYQSLWLVLLGLFFTVHIGIASADGQLDSITASKKTFPQYQVFDAVVEAVNHSTVSSRISAQVIEINYDVNDVVPKGAVIMKFQDAEFQARVAQIEANILADKAQSREAIARQKEANAEAKRVKSLFARKLISQAALDTANANLSAANARVQAIQAQYKSRQAQLTEAKVQLSYTQIIAPYSGVVTDRLIELGEMVSPGQHLMTGLSLEKLRVVANIPQYLLPEIQASTNPIFALTDGREIKGIKQTIIPQADVATHSFKVRIDLPTPVENLYPGMFGKLHFSVGNETILVIPQSSIVQRSEVAGVYVISDQHNITFRQLRLGRLFEGSQQEILAGLSEGEVVAADPLQAARLLKLEYSRSQL